MTKNIAHDYMTNRQVPGQVKNTEVRKPKYGNKSMETEVQSEMKSCLLESSALLTYGCALWPKGDWIWPHLLAVTCIMIVTLAAVIEPKIWPSHCQDRVTLWVQGLNPHSCELVRC